MLKPKKQAESKETLSDKHRKFPSHVKLNFTRHTTVKSPSATRGQVEHKHRHSWIPQKKHNLPKRSTKKSSSTLFGFIFLVITAAIVGKSNRKLRIRPFKCSTIATHRGYRLSDQDSEKIRELRNAKAVAGFSKHPLEADRCITWSFVSRGMVCLWNSRFTTQWFEKVIRGGGTRIHKLSMCRRSTT